MRILNLLDGRISLEFAHSEWPRIESALASLAGTNGYVVREEATHDMISIGETELILMDEWDEPCLISISGLGDQLLRRVSSKARKPTIDTLRADRKRNTSLAA